MHAVKVRDDSYMMEPVLKVGLLDNGPSSELVALYILQEVVSGILLPFVHNVGKYAYRSQACEYGTAVVPSTTEEEEFVEETKYEAPCSYTSESSSISGREVGISCVLVRWATECSR